MTNRELWQAVELLSLDLKYHEGPEPAKATAARETLMTAMNRYLLNGYTG